MKKTIVLLLFLHLLNAAYSQGVTFIGVGGGTKIVDKTWNVGNMYTGIPFQGMYGSVVGTYDSSPDSLDLNFKTGNVRFTKIATFSSGQPTRFTWIDPSTGYIKNSLVADVRLDYSTNITDKPSLSAVALSGDYNDLINKPALFNGTFTALTGKPTTLSGYGITDAYPLSGNPLAFLTSVPVQSFASLTGKPTTLSGYGIMDGVVTSVTVNGHALSSNVTVTKTDLSINNVDNTADVNKNVLSATKLTTARTINGVSFDGTSNISIPGLKRQEPYTGTTAGSGTYTITYATAFAVTPNVQYNLIGGAVTNFPRITASTNTGFTITVQNRIDVIGLLPTYPTLNGAVVDVLVTEK